MGQGDVMNALEKANKPLTTRGVSRITGTSQSTTSAVLRKLKTEGIVDYYVVKERTGGSTNPINVRYHFIVKGNI